MQHYTQICDGEGKYVHMIVYMYMEIHVHSTLAMLEVGRKERQPRQARHIIPRPNKQDTQHKDHRNKTHVHPGFELTS